MLTVIVAGGKGSRILEETLTKPKALVKIGEKAIIEHIIDGYVSQGFHDFLILSGYKGEMIADYFKEKSGALSWKIEGNSLIVHFFEFRIRILYTGEETGSAARLRMAAPYIRGNSFMLTYCDGLCGISFSDLIQFHETYGGMVTLTAVRPDPRFGILEIDSSGRVKSFREKACADAPVINGGFMIFDQEIFSFLTEEMEQLERDVLMPLADRGELTAYFYDGFWQCMDTLQEKNYLCSLWERKPVPWMRNRK